MHVPQFTFTMAMTALLLISAPGNTAPPGWQATTAQVLAAQRGGFLGDNGLLISLGVERIVAVNGVTVARTTIDIPDVASMNWQQARETGAALSTIKLVQVGGGNMVLAAMPDQMPIGTVIQNTLNDQRIDSRTIISASVNSTALLNTLHFHGNLSDAIARAAGP